jgi:hypothetical protein
VSSADGYRDMRVLRGVSRCPYRKCACRYAPSSTGRSTVTDREWKGAKWRDQTEIRTKHRRVGTFGQHPAVAPDGASPFPFPRPVNPLLTPSSPWHADSWTPQIQPTSAQVNLSSALVDPSSHLSPSPYYRSKRVMFASLAKHAD